MRQWIKYSQTGRKCIIQDFFYIWNSELNSSEARVRKNFKLTERERYWRLLVEGKNDNIIKESVTAKFVHQI